MCLSLTLFSFQTPSYAASSNFKIKNTTLNGKENSNLSSYGENILDNLNSINFNITELNLNNGLLNLKGTLTTGSEENVIDLNGNIYSSTSKNSMVGDLKESSDKYEVVYFSILKGDSVESRVANNKKSNDSIIKIYLLEKNTRKFFMIEDSIMITNFNQLKIICLI